MKLNKYVVIVLMCLTSGLGAMERRPQSCPTVSMEIEQSARAASAAPTPALDLLANVAMQAEQTEAAKHEGDPRAQQKRIADQRHAIAPTGALDRLSLSGLKDGTSKNRSSLQEHINTLAKNGQLTTFRFNVSGQLIDVTGKQFTQEAPSDRIIAFHKAEQEKQVERAARALKEAITACRNAISEAGEAQKELAAAQANNSTVLMEKMKVCRTAFAVDIRKKELIKAQGDFAKVQKAEGFIAWMNSQQ